jgi:outer membrane autotransporter protein
MSRLHERLGALATRRGMVALVLPCAALISHSQAVRAQACSTNPSGAPGSILQNGGTCVISSPVTTGFGIAVNAENSANVTLTPAGTVTATGGGTGISASTGAMVTANGNVTADSVALTAATGSTITANNITLGNTGGGSMAVLANAATVNLNHVSMTWPGGFGGALVEATGGGLVQFTNTGTINVPSGSESSVLLADGAGSRIIADTLNLQIGTVSAPTRGLGLGNGNAAIRAQGGGNVQITDGGTVTFLVGGGDTGFLATGTGSSITANNVSLADGSGGGDAGALSTAGGKITLNGGSVTVPGSGGGEAGLAAIGASSLVTADNVTVKVSGAAGDAGVNAQTGGTVVTSGGSVSVLNGAGGLLQGGGIVTMTGTNVTASGSGGIGFLFNGGGSANTLTYSNGTITASEASFSVQGSTADISLVNTIATVNNNTLLETLSSGVTTFNAQASTLRGVITTDPSISTVNLTQGTVWTMTGNSNATNVTNNASTIIYTPPTGDPTLLSSYKTLTATNYVGVGGTIQLNTYLGNDSAPSDRLVIINGGTATGSTGLRILNTTGPGDQTVANGILVVQTLDNATTAPGAFSLLNPELRAGAYDYFLFRGGINGNAPQDWFLRSTFFSPSTPVPPIGMIPPPDLVDPPPVLPPEPPPTVLPPGKFPIIGPELATDGVAQPIARQMGLTTLGTLHERVGDAAADAACLGADLTGNSAALDSAVITKAPPVPYNNCQQAVWGRLFGQQIDNHYQAFADPRASGQVAGIQAGADIWRGSLIPGHSDSAGVYFAYSNGNVGVDGLVTNPAATAYILEHTGSVNLNAYSIGGYWTHYGPTGWYIDAVLQGSFYNGNAATQFANLPISGTGFTSSLETGYPIALPWFGPRFVLEPEGQIIWQRVSFDDANDGLGPVGLGTTSGATGRLGLRGKWTIDDSAGRVWQPYVVANVWRDWGANATTMFGIDSVPLLEQATRLEFAGGLSAKIRAGLSLYAQAGYQIAVSGTDGGRRDGVKADFGVHYGW